MGPLELDPKVIILLQGSGSKLFHVFFPCQISAKSQSWADELERKKASLFDGQNLHSTQDNEGLYNSENLGESKTATDSVKMFYNEIKHYDFNNQGHNSYPLGREGKVVGRSFQFINLISSTSGH